jgi:hypothetical protein
VVDVMSKNRIHRHKFLSAVVAVISLAVFSGGTAARAAADCRESDTAQGSFKELIANAETIVLATANNAEPTLFSTEGTLKFIFDIDETLKGYQPRPLRIKARLNVDDPEYPRGSLDDHKRMGFWDRMETRLVHVSSCRQELNFRLGGTYLLIDPGKRLAPMSIAVEEIEDVDADLWLAAVRKLIADPQAEPMTMTIDEYFKAQQSVVFAVMEYCNEKLRDGGFRVAEISQPLSGDPVTRDGINPDIFKAALKGCDGFTAMLAIFYQPDKSRPTEAPLGSTVYPGQRYLRLDGDKVPVSKLRTEIKIVGPDSVPLPELVEALKEP